MATHVSIEKRARIETVIYLNCFKWKTLSNKQLLDVLKVINPEVIDKVSK